MKEKTVHILNEDELADFARDFLSTLPDPKDRARVIGLSGELGAGKTTFVQKTATALGVEESATSPTYVILKKYDVENPSHPTPYTLLIHIDAYRLEDASELEKLDWETYISDPHNLIMIEWPENVSDILPDDMITINFEVTEGSEREITTHNV